MDEGFEAVFDSIATNPELKDKRIVVWGGSKGAELALLLASKFDQINGVISMTPSSVAWAGLGPNTWSGNQVSSWTYRGEQIPFVPYVPFDFRTIVDNQFLEVYTLSLKQTDLVEAATIKVENINGPILLISGKEDLMWPTFQMGETIIKRLKDKSFPHWFRHFSYEDTGHSVAGFNTSVSENDSDRDARLDVAQRILEFLEMIAGN